MSQVIGTQEDEDEAEQEVTLQRWVVSECPYNAT